MIKHCVFIKFSPNTSEHQRQLLYQAVRDLKHHLHGWLGFIAGANITPEAGMDKGYNGGFIIDFENESARDAYLVDEQHQHVGSEIVTCAEGGVDGVLVFDLEAG
ncbi:MAG: Dabb family protein [Gammaproteobacteria bacterium]|nr:Dabb family protein [Gammaproteobacteria bacterium]